MNFGGFKEEASARLPSISSASLEATCMAWHGPERKISFPLSRGFSLGFPLPCYITSRECNSCHLVGSKSTRVEAEPCRAKR